MAEDHLRIYIKLIFCNQGSNIHTWASSLANDILFIANVVKNNKGLPPTA